MIKKHICEYCNKELETGQKLGGHVVRCRSNPKFDQYIKRVAASNTQQRINYILICHKCSKEYNITLTKKQYNSGKYRKHCSRHCANGIQWTEQDKLKKSIAAKNSQKHKLAARSRIKYEAVHICLVCNKQFKTRNVQQKFCSRQCVNQGQKLGLFNITKTLGGYRTKGGRGKQGWYKGIYCNSSWQLAYVMYCKDHKIDIKRNNTGYQYLFEDVQQMHYYPDFIINGQQFVQVKGFKDNRWQYKIKYFPYELKVIDGDSISPYLEYAKQTYGVDFVQLYE